MTMGADIDFRANPRYHADALPVYFGSAQDSRVLYDGTNDEWTVQTKDSGGTQTDRIRAKGNADITTVELYNDDPGATGIRLDVHHDSASQADNDVVFHMRVYGNDDAGTPVKTQYGGLKVTALDTTDASEDGKVTLEVMTAGTLRALDTPVITADDTIVVLGLAQTFTADKTFNDNVKRTFGTGGDVDIYFDAANLIMDVQVAGTGHFIINEGDVTSDSLHSTGMLNLNTTDASNRGPRICTYHNSTSPADSDIPFILDAFANDSGGTVRNLGEITIKWGDVTSTTMDSSMAFRTMNAVNAGDANTTATLTNAGVWTDASAAKDKKYEGDALAVWGERVIDMLPKLAVGRYHSIRKPATNPEDHHVSPTAEDLWDLFGVGTDPYKLNQDLDGDGIDDAPTPGIAAKDLAGIGLMAIQELIEENTKLKARVAILEPA